MIRVVSAQNINALGLVNGEPKGVQGLMLTKVFWRFSPMKNAKKTNWIVLTAMVGAFGLAGVATLSAAPASVKIDGYVSDSMCGAGHNSAKPNVACVKKCVGEGSKAVFVDDKTGSVWEIDNQEAVKGHLGHHIQVTGTADTEKKSVHIDAVTMLAQN